MKSIPARSGRSPDGRTPKPRVWNRGVPDAGHSREHKGRFRLMTRRITLLAGLLVLLAGVALLAGCGAPAQAEPLEVTYYYMPG